AVEVAAAERLPAGRMRADADAAGPLAVLDFPEIDIAAGRIEPDQVGRSVVIEVAPAIQGVSGRMCADVDAAGPFRIPDLPEVDVESCRIEPEDVGGAVMIEVAGSRNVACRMRAHVARRHPVRDRRELDLRTSGSVVRRTEVSGLGIVDDQ